MFCSVYYPDGRPFEMDTRAILANAVKEAEQEGLTFFFGPEMEFYLFRLDDTGAATKVPYDTAGYMDVAPEDKRRKRAPRGVPDPLSRWASTRRARTTKAPGRNEIDFRYADPL